MSKSLKRILLIFLASVVIIAAISALAFLNELRSLSTLKRIDNYPMYKMTYYGDYGFDSFLKTGAKRDADIEAFVTKRLLKGLPVKLGVTGGGCTAFVTKNDKGEIIYGRNFDFGYTPSLQLYTTPRKGYKSVSTVNLTYAGYSKGKLPRGLSVDSFLTLAAPYLPFDGMNEKGVTMALLAVPEVHYKDDESKITLNTTTAIRLVLDYAANVDEAVGLLKKYNIYFSGGINCHYLIADAQGKSVIVEYWDGKLQTVTPTQKYQIASNFIAYKGLNIGEGFTEFDRYKAVEEQIKANNNTLSEKQAVDLLARIGVIDNGEDKLQWSVLYNLTTLEGKIFAHRNRNNISNFKLH